MKKYHYLYLLFDKENNFYIGRRSCDIDPSIDRYMGSSRNKKFFPIKKRIISIVDNENILKEKERFLIRKFISNKKCMNLAVPPINDVWGTFKWANNGEKNIQIRGSECLPEGFKFGRFKPFGNNHPTIGTYQWIKGGETKRSKNCPGEGWIRGSYYNGSKNLNSRATTGFKWITNGVESKLVNSDFYLEEGWRYGRVIKDEKSKA